MGNVLTSIKKIYMYQTCLSPQLGNNLYLRQEYFSFYGWSNILKKYCWHIFFYNPFVCALLSSRIPESFVLMLHRPKAYTFWVVCKLWCDLLFVWEKILSTYISNSERDCKKCYVWYMFKSSTRKEPLPSTRVSFNL